MSIGDDLAREDEPRDRFRLAAEVSVAEFVGLRALPDGKANKPSIYRTLIGAKVVIRRFKTKVATLSKRWTIRSATLDSEILYPGEGRASDDRETSKGNAAPRVV